MKPIRKVQTKNYIAELLRNEIFLGNIYDGEELTQELIAKKLGVSRMPVREALQLLEQEGFLQRLPNRHMRVNVVSAKSILYNFRVLSALETEIILMLLQENKDISPIEKAFIDLETSRVDQSYVGKIIAFHKQISVQLGDQYIESLHERIMAGYFTFALKRFPNYCKNSVEMLRPILKAMQLKEDKDLRHKIDEYFKLIAYVMIKEGDGE